MTGEQISETERLSLSAWFEILIVLLKVRLTLKIHGFGRTWARIQASPSRADSAQRPQRPQLVNQAVATVSTLLPGRVRCLEQALASYILLRRSTPDVTLRIGVTPNGFRAHAWVEVNGLPLNENADFLHTLGVFELPT